MTILNDDVLRVVAAAEGISATSLRLKDGVVWHAVDDGTWRTICQVGTPFWCVAALTAAAIAQASL